MRNSSGQQGENELQCKNANGNRSDRFFCEHIRHFLHKTCNQEVSRSSRAEQQQRNVRKSVLHVQSIFFFFAN